MSLKREVRTILDTLVEQGWNIHMSGGDHYRLQPPQKCYPIQFISQTPSDWRAIKNIKSQLRKAGAKI